jgi:hypothetical protein
MNLWRSFIPPGNSNFGITADLMSTTVLISHGHFSGYRFIVKLCPLLVSKWYAVAVVLTDRVRRNYSAIRTAQSALFSISPVLFPRQKIDSS